MLGPGFQNRHVSDAVKGFVLDGGLPAVLGLVFFELHHFVHDQLPVAGGDLWIARGQIGAGNLQVHGRMLLGLLPRVEQANGGGGRAPVSTFDRLIFTALIIRSAR
jgi:hypothetical protein